MRLVFDIFNCHFIIFFLSQCLNICIFDMKFAEKKYGNFLQFYNAIDRIDPNVTPVFVNKLQEMDSKNHFEKLEKSTT